jgi:alginate production protein
MKKPPIESYQWLFLTCLLLFAPGLALGSGVLDGIVPGSWVEVRGQLDGQGVFQATRVELADRAGEELLIGTVSASSVPGDFMLLGQLVQISSKTRFSGLSADTLLNSRVKLEGHYRGPKRFSARKIKVRSPGRDRIAGLVSYISQIDGGYSLTIMNHEIHVPQEAELRHDRPVHEYAVYSLNIGLPVGKQVSEDDQFGEGFRISDRIRFTTLLEARYAGEDNYNLDSGKDRDLDDFAASIRGRFILFPSDHGISGQFEVRHIRLRRNVGPFGAFSIYDTRISESFIFLDDPFEVYFDIQAGRMDFDDRREWLYDQDLDGLRVYWKVGGWLAELSATTTLSDGKPRDENTNNFIAYFSDKDRRLAAYVIRRDTDLFDLSRKVTHMGVRAFLEWPPQHESWLEVSRMSGSEGDTDLHGWGLDVGTVRNIGARWYVIAGWAFGQGDADTDDGKNGTFRQTRLQDNNGKFGGVTSYRYYGELIDPELANLHIGTLGAGYRFTKKGSIDLIGHYYRQDKAVRKIIDSDLDRRPNGIDRELGWEIDAVVGWRPVRAWDFEFVLGWFRPGKAFPDRNDAWVSKLQIRYRY